MKILYILFITCVLVTASPAFSQQQPVIATEVGRLLAEDDIDAAKARFNELAKSDSLDMSTEISGLHTLMAAYMKSGNHAAAEAVAEMASELTMTMISGGMGMDMEAMKKAEAAAKEQEKRHQEEEQKLAQKQKTQSQGKSRDDLGRFAGLYGEMGSGDLGKTIFVTVSCDGYMVAGPMWADVGPWWMRAAAEYVFTYSDSWMSFSMEFKQDEQSGTYRISHEIEGVGTPIEWKATLPDDFGNCVERTYR